MLVLYLAILAYGLNEFRHTPIGFIPQVDRGYLITVLQLPPGSSLARTDEVQRRVVEICLQTPGIAHAVSIVGFSGASFTNARSLAGVRGRSFTNAQTPGALFLIPEDWANRGRDPKLSAAGITRELLSRLSGIQEGLVLVVQPPPIAGIGNTGGFRMMVEDRQ